MIYAQRRQGARMLKELEILCEMQEFDDKIQAAMKEKKRLPRLLNELEEKVRREEEGIANLRQRLEQNRHEQKRLELDIAENNERINKYERQLLEIKTNKEYKALNSEITSVKEQNAQIEEQLIELMEEETVLRKEQKKIGEEAEKHKKELEAEKAKIQERMAALDKEIAESEEKKKKLAKDIPELLYRRYERLIKHKDGKAIATVDNAVCSGCHLRIRPQILIEVAKQDSIVTCENCSRILVPPKKAGKED